MNSAVLYDSKCVVASWRMNKTRLQDIFLGKNFSGILCIEEWKGTC